MPAKGEFKANAKPASKAKRAFNRKTQDKHVGLLRKKGELRRGMVRR